MKNEQLQKWALIAEVTGGIAVVVTLAFVAVEMRANTNAIQAQTYQELMQQVNNYREILLENVDRYEILAKLEANGWNALTRAEQQRVRLPSQILWGVYESAYFANDRGVLGEREWVRFENRICGNYQPESVMWSPPGGASMENLLTPEFVDYIKTNCVSE